MVDEIIPSHRLVLGGLELEGGHLLHGGIALVISCVQEKNFVSGNSQPRCHWTTPGARSNYDIVIFSRL